MLHLVLETALQFINQENYETTKSQYGASIPEYFSGNYETFKQKRNELTKLFVAAGYSNVQRDSYRRTLSPESAKAYAMCMAETSRKPIAAWISEYSDDKIIINVRSGRDGEKIKYEVLGETPINKPSILPPQGTEALIFKYDPSKDFMIAINAVGELTPLADTTVVQLPRARHFEIRKEQKELSASFTCGAGCQRRTDGCQISTDAIFVADQDYYLLYDTRKIVRQDVIGGPGLQHFDVDWIIGSEPGEKPRRIIAHPFNINGNSGDTQGIVQVACSIIAEREYVVEVIPSATAPLKIA